MEEVVVVVEWLALEVEEGVVVLKWTADNKYIQKPRIDDTSMHIYIRCGAKNAASMGTTDLYVYRYASDKNKSFHTDNACSEV